MPKSKFTLEKEYLQNNGKRCFFCKSKKLIVMSLPQPDNDILYQEKKCLRCGSSWVENYTLSSVELEGVKDGRN